MNFWNVMNWVAWGLCGVFAYLIISDYVKVEKGQRANEGQGKN